MINRENNDRQRVVIVGGGFAGLNLAKSIDKKKFDVIIIDRNNYHSFPPLFYQVASAGLEPGGISFPLRREINKRSMRGVKFVMGDVSEIKTDTKAVIIDGKELGYDRLVIASGTTNNFFNMPDLEKKVYTLKSTSDAISCRNAILERLERASIETDVERRRHMLSFVVIGGGPAGVEIAGALGEMKKYILEREYPSISLDDVSITLMEGNSKLLAAMSEASSREAEKYLGDLMVNVRLGATMTRYDNGTVTLADGTSVDAGMVLWTAGVTGVTFRFTGTDYRQGRGNRFEVDEHNRVKGLEDIYAIGDIALMVTEEYPHGHPQLAQVAIQQGRTLGRYFNNGDIGKPFSYYDKGTMATVGRNRAVVDLKHAHFSGWFAWITWMFIHLISLLGMRNKVSVLIDWTWAYFTYGSSLRLLLKQSRYPIENTD